MKTINWFNYSSVLIVLIIIFPVQATEPLWITENTSTNEIVAALTLPSNPNELYRDIVDIVEKHPKVAVQINFAYDSSNLNQRAKTLLGKLGRVFQGELSEAVFILAGHTDSKGSATYNLGLSLTVYNSLIGDFCLVSCAKPKSDQEKILQAKLEQERQENEALQRKLDALKNQPQVVAPKPEEPSKFFRDTLIDGSKGSEMVRIPAGSFRMGDIQGGGDSDEKPVHRVSVGAFAMGKYEVTFAEYDKFAVATGKKKP